MTTRRKPIPTAIPSSILPPPPDIEPAAFTIKPAAKMKFFKLFAIIATSALGGGLTWAVAGQAVVDTFLN